MTEPAASKRSWWKLVAAVLAVEVIGLSVALYRATHEAPEPPPNAVRVIDVAKQAAALDELTADKPDTQTRLFHAKQGSIELRSVTYQQRVPLHLHRMQQEALAPITGTLEAQRWQNNAPVTSPLTPSTVLTLPAYEASALVNPSADHVATVLAFVSTPEDDATFLAPGDELLQLSGSSTVFDVSAHPGDEKVLPVLDGKLSSLSVTAQKTVSRKGTPTAVWVVSGHGSLSAQGTHALAPATLALVPEGVEASVTATSGETLALVLFQPANDGVTDIVKAGSKQHSQDDEELVIRDALKEMKGGVFLDVGASDWERSSTTWFLEEQLGWSGVAIDALAEHAKGYEEHRKKTQFVNALITDKGRGKVKFYRAGSMTELSSTDPRLAHDQEQNFMGDQKVTEVEVESTSLNELLEKLNVPHIDFMSMDIENHEPEGLAGFDVQKYQPKLVCVEAHQIIRDRLFRYFRERGYVRLDRYMPYDSANWYFAPAPAAP